MATGYAAIGLACAFLSLLTLLHFLKPELDPAWRWISEYEIGRFGWMMRLAFFCWGGSVLALSITLWSAPRSGLGTLGTGWLAVISVALFGAGVFKTAPITDRTPSRENSLHAICGAVVILTFPIAATLTAVSLLGGAALSGGTGSVVLATTLTWVGLVTFMASNIVAGIRSPSRERVGNPDIRIGWQNRFIVVSYVVWVILVSAALWRS